jgi:hypothetical protein
MHAGKTLLAQVMSFLPWSTFARIVARYGGDRSVRSLRCSEQYRAMAFAQLTGRQSLRDLEACLAARPAKLYHSGFHAPVRRATLADANERRDWRISADFAQRLIGQARRLYADEPVLADLDSPTYALDSTTIDLCLSLFPWAAFRKTKAAVKMHTLLDLRGSIPSFIHVSEGRLHDVNVLDLLVPEAGATYLMDRAYVDFRRLYTLHQAGAGFVTRAKKNFRARRLYSRPTDRARGLIADQTVALDGVRSKHYYPEHLRRIRYKDPASDKTLVFLTNRANLPALTVCDLYRSRWKVELFFKFVKGNLRIQRFLGTSENAVKSQLWIAVSVYVLVAILRKRLDLDTPLHTMLQILSVMPFEQVTLYEALTTHDGDLGPPASAAQLPLFAT